MKEHIALHLCKSVYSFLRSRACIIYLTLNLQVECGNAESDAEGGQPRSVMECQLEAFLNELSSYTLCITQASI